MSSVTICFSGLSTGGYYDEQGMFHPYEETDGNTFNYQWWYSMTCPHCNAWLANYFGFKYCPYCGKELFPKKKCPHCHKELDE